MMASSVAACGSDPDAPRRLRRAMPSGVAHRKMLERHVQQPEQQQRPHWREPQASGQRQSDDHEYPDQNQLEFVKVG
jgi:hypothetical protein